jgi:flagellar hook-basal body complex protein FliE
MKSGAVENGEWCVCGLIAPAPGSSCARCGKITAKPDTPKRLTEEQLERLYRHIDDETLASLQGHIAALTLERDAITKELTIAMLRAENWTAQAAAVTLERDKAVKALREIAEMPGYWRDMRDSARAALKELEETKE